MDFYVRLGINVLLQVLADRKEARRFYPALAKVYVQIERLAQLDENLMTEVERQRKKEGLT